MILYSKREWGARVKLANIRRVVEAARASFRFKPDMVISIETTPIIAVSFYFGEIHRDYFQAKFGVQLEDHFPREVAFVIQHGLMEVAGPYLRLTRRGADHFNGVVALFYAGAVKDYLIHLS